MALFVEERAAGPGLQGRRAAALGRPGQRLIFVAAPGEPVSVHARQHVTADGKLVANQVLWAERAGLAWAFAEPDPDRLLALDDNAVVAIDPAHAGAMDCAALARRAVAAGHRWVVAGEEARPEPPAANGPAVGILGPADRLTNVYPAVVAALGDAAEAAGLAIEPRFVDPADLPADPATALADLAGLVLPGGADLGQVAGQIAAARWALAADRPVLGLCLGMQCLTLAVARDRLPDAVLEEQAPDAPTLLFERLRDAHGRPDHRLGDVPVTLRAGTAIADRVAAATGPWTAPAGLIERANHRYRLAPRYRPEVEAAGLHIIGEDRARDIAYVVSHHGARCALGFEGHPELQSRPGAPHPAFTEFLAAMAGG